MNEREKRIAALIEDEDFGVRAESAASIEEIVQLFAERSVEITEDEINAILVGVGDELDETGLEAVSGGGAKLKAWWSHYKQYWKGVWAGITEKL